MALPDGIRKIKSSLVGTSYNWSTDGSVKQLHYSVTEMSRGGMPINFTHQRGPNGKFRSGGPWGMYQQKHRFNAPPDMKVYRKGYNNPAFSGTFPLLPAYRETRFLVGGYDSVEEAYIDLWESGAKALSKMRPDAPTFESALSLLELKDTLPYFKEALKALIRKVRRKKPKYKAPSAPHKEYADKHLETQFGFIPLAKALADWFDAYIALDKNFQELLKDAGKSVKRIKGLGKTKKVEPQARVTTSGRHHPALGAVQVTQCYASDGVTHTDSTITRTTNTWCMGKFKYILPPGPRDAQWTRRIRRRMMGGYISASVLYNLIPWSWLADYFTGLGDFMEAVSPGVADRCVLEYGYLMRTVSVKRDDKYWMAVNLAPSGSYHWVNATASYETLFKLRAPATIYGWGISDDDLSLHQKGIVGALGLSKL